MYINQNDLPISEVIPVAYIGLGTYRDINVSAGNTQIAMFLSL